jgi:hypothetical protein
MKKGIVLEIDDDFVTLLTPDGEFVQIKKEGSYQIGQEIERIPMQRQKIKKSFVHFSSFKLAVASIAAVCLLVFSLFSSATSNEVYAYLSIDINPSIELTINKKLEVINVRGFNQDGQKLVANLSDWKEKKFVDVAKKIIELSRKNGYLNEGEEVLITTVEKESNRSSSQRLAEELDEVKRSYQKQDIVVKIEKSTLEMREEAAEKGLTTGKYMKLIKKENNASNQNQEENIPMDRDQNESNDNHFQPSSNMLKKEQEPKHQEQLQLEREQEVQQKPKYQEQPQLEREEQIKMKKRVPSNQFVDREEKNQEKQELKRKEIKEKKREDRKEREKERRAQKKQKNRNRNADKHQRIEREHKREYERENDE